MPTFAPMSGARALAAALLVLSSACAHGRGDGARARDLGPVIESVDIEGAEVVRARELRRGLQTQATGSWPWSEVQRLDPVALSTDVRRVLNVYRMRGYYGASASEQVVATGEDRVRVLIRVREGPPTRVSEIRLEGAEVLPDDTRAQLVANLPIARGEVLRADQYEEALALLQGRLREEGHAAARVEGHVDVYPDARVATVRFTVEPGPVFRYGEVRVEGLRAIPADPVRAIVRRAVPEGTTFSPASLEDAQGRVFNLGAFTGVRIGVEDEPADPARALVQVRLEEAPVHTLQLGGGIGFESNLQQLQVLAEYRNTNLLGDVRRLAWHNEVALRFLPSFISANRKGLAAETTLEVTQPELFARTDGAVRVGYERMFRQAFEADALTTRVGFPYHPGRRVLVSPSLNWERFFGAVGRTPAGPRPVPLSTKCSEPCALSYLALESAIDRRDDLITTRSGYLASGGFHYGAPVLGSGFHFLRFDPEVRAFWPVAEGLVLAGRARLGALFTFGGDESPIMQRFYGGGEGGHRGFGSEQLSPLVQDAEGDFVPIGGDGLWLVTGEVRVRFTERWGAVAFGDWGDVTIDPFSFRLGGSHLALGAGVRLYTLAGPVRLDVAWRVTGGARVALDTGAEVDTRPLDYLSFQLSLGEAF